MQLLDHIKLNEYTECTKEKYNETMHELAELLCRMGY